MNNLKQITAEITEVLNNVNEQELNDVSELITQEKRVFIIGAGRNGLQGRAFAMRLMHIGYTSYFVGETISPAIREGDILVAISGSGETGSILTVCKKALKAGATVIAVTSQADSSIGHLAEKVMTIPASTRGSGEKSSIQLLSSIFDQSVHIMLDSLALKVATRDGIDDSFANKMHSNLE